MNRLDIDSWARAIASAHTIKESRSLVRSLYQLGYERGRAKEAEDNLKFMKENFYV